jgi:hypothetical protein
MGVYTFLTLGNDVSVRAPGQGEVLTGNAAGAWEPRRHDHLQAFPLLSEIRDTLVAFSRRVDHLQAVIDTLVAQAPASPRKGA